jgi:hypothetical protein
MSVERFPLRISADLKARLSARVVQDQYGPRGKSRWIREALVKMLEDDPNMHRVGQGDKLEEHKMKELVTFSDSFVLWLKDKILEFQIGAPGLIGARSLLLRSAIRFRLDRPEVFLAKLPSSSRQRRR